jgi:very-short-patch-repair endonuclease
MEKTIIKNKKATKDQRRTLRTYGTPAEAVVWEMLKNRKIEGLKFRRQHSVGPYILDFFCPELALAIELDGAVHDNPNSEEYDEARANYLSKVAGITVLRFENKEAYCNQELITWSIREFVRSRGGHKRPTTPSAADAAATPP